MTISLPTRKIGAFTVSAIGLGCMNLFHAYLARLEPVQAERVLLHAQDAGVTFFETAALHTAVAAYQSRISNFCQSSASSCGRQTQKTHFRFSPQRIPLPIVLAYQEEGRNLATLAPRLRFHRAIDKDAALQPLRSTVALDPRR